MSQSSPRTGTDPNTGSYNTTERALVPYYGHKDHRDDRDYTKHPEVMSVREVPRRPWDRCLPFGKFKEVDPKHKSFRISEADSGIVNDQLDKINRKKKKEWEQKTYGLLSSSKSRYKGLDTIEADKKEASERPLDYLAQEEEDRVIGLLKEVRKPLWDSQRKFPILESTWKDNRKPLSQKMRFKDAVFSLAEFDQAERRLKSNESVQKHISELRTGLRKTRLNDGTYTLSHGLFSRDRNEYIDVMSFINAYGFNKDQLIKEGKKVKTLMDSYYWEIGDADELFSDSRQMTTYCPALDERCNLHWQSGDQAAESLLSAYNQKVETVLKDFKNFSDTFEAISWACNSRIRLGDDGTYGDRERALRYLDYAQNKLEERIQDAVRVHSCQRPCPLSRTWESMLEDSQQHQHQQPSNPDIHEDDQLSPLSASSQRTCKQQSGNGSGSSSSPINQWKSQCEDWHNMKKYFSKYGTTMTDLCALVEPSYNIRPSRYDDLVESILRNEYSR